MQHSCVCHSYGSFLCQRSHTAIARLLRTNCHSVSCTADAAAAAAAGAFVEALDTSHTHSLEYHCQPFCLPLPLPACLVWPAYTTTTPTSCPLHLIYLMLNEVIQHLIHMSHHVIAETSTGVPGCAAELVSRLAHTAVRLTGPCTADCPAQTTTACKRHNSRVTDCWEQHN